MEFEQFVSSEIEGLRIAHDLLRTSVNLLEIRLAIVETQMRQLLWVGKAVLGAGIAIFVAEAIRIWQLHQNGRKH